MTTERIVLVTGSTSGIGLGLARRYAATGARVVLTGRSTERLAAAQRQVGAADTFAGDLADPDQRDRLTDHVASRFGGLTVLVNNAGVQRRVEVAADHDAWAVRQAEIDLLLGAPIDLTTMVTPLLLRAGHCAQVVNVTSGGAFVPQPFAPVYSAAKAAVHSWTQNLRHALAPAGVAVTELIPPAVDTGLAGPGRRHGADPDEFCDAVFPLLERRLPHVGFGATATAAFAELLTGDDERFAAGATRFPVARYGAGAS